MNQDDELPLQSLQSLEDIYHGRAHQTIYTDLYELYFAVFQLICKKLGVEIERPTSDITYKPDALQYMQLIAESNALRMRKIKLKKNWWQFDNGPLIVFYKKVPCALIPQKNGRYELINLAKGTRQRLTNDMIQDLKKTVYMVYPTLPSSKISIGNILSFTFSTLKTDMVTIVAYQLLVSLLMLLIPILTGVIFDKVIPYSNLPLLGQYTLILFLTSLIILLINLIQTKALLHLQIMAKHKIQVGIWDRLLRLPLSFFRKFSTGELSYRASIVDEIQEILGTNVIMTIISSIMSVINLALMIFINGYLAFAAVILAIIIGLTSLLFNFLILRQERNVINQKSIINGVLYSLINQIVKIRISHKESASFNVWNKSFAQKMSAQNQVNHYANGLNVFNVAYMGFCTLVIYSLVIWLGSAIRLSEFIIFDAAFIQFFTAMISMSTILSQSIEIIPLLNKAKPIFECIPEDDKNKNTAVLNGHIVMNNVVFRYTKNTKPIFINFNLEIKPGSFTAIVGPSGSGKSTIFRLLLGLENVESGDIKYSGIDINNIQLRSLRSQIGVVMQSTQLIPGTIFENITGSNYKMTREQAWEVATKVGLENTIRDLPMGIDTLLNDGIQTLSGGEVQRINLARAISSNPKILMLDEATSALDNRVQYQIHQFLQEMNLTRIVIAHRLSTIIHADIIHVIDGGRCVESGNYDDLMKAHGLFYKMASQSA